MYIPECSLMLVASVHSEYLQGSCEFSGFLGREGAPTVRHRFIDQALKLPNF